MEKKERTKRGSFIDDFYTIKTAEYLHILLFGHIYNYVLKVGSFFISL